MLIFWHSLLWRRRNNSWLDVCKVYKSGLASSKLERKLLKFCPNLKRDQDIHVLIIFQVCCCLCNLRGGALASTTDNRWCHIVCALINTDTDLGKGKGATSKGGRLQGIDISHIPKKRQTSVTWFNYTSFVVDYCDLETNHKWWKKNLNKPDSLPLTFHGIPTTTPFLIPPFWGNGKTPS